MDFRHEIISKFVSKHELITNTNLREFVSKLHPDVVTDEQYVCFQKNEFKELAHGIKTYTSKWSQIAKWRVKTNRRYSKEVFNLAEEMLKTTNRPEIKIINKELLDNKLVKNPEELYNLLCETIKNAIKHSEGKPTEIRLEELTKNGKSGCYATFFTENAKPISNYKIEDIITVNPDIDNYMVKSNIKNTEYGFLMMVKMLKRNLRALDVPDMIEKRDKGVRIQIPLIGVQ